VASAIPSQLRAGERHPRPRSGAMPPRPTSPMSCGGLAQAAQPFRRLRTDNYVGSVACTATRHVLGGEAVENAGDLERAREPKRAAPSGRKTGDIAPVEDEAPGHRRELAGQLPDQRGLPAPFGRSARASRPGMRQRHVVRRDERGRTPCAGARSPAGTRSLAAPGLDSAQFGISRTLDRFGKSTLGSPGLSLLSSCAPVSAQHAQIPSRTSSTRMTSKGRRTSIQCRLKSESTSLKPERRRPRTARSANWPNRGSPSRGISPDIAAPASRD